MTLQLLHTQMNQLHLEALPLDSEANSEDRQLDLEYQVHFDPIQKDVFSISFDVSVRHPNELFLEATCVAWFQSSELIPEEIRDSPFFNINAPAIAFPYLRSIISMVTLTSGFNPVLLPSVNFIEANEMRKKENPNQ